MNKIWGICLIVLGLVLAGCKDMQITGGAVAVDRAIDGCKDSDGGVNKEVKGMVSAGEDIYADSCVGGLLIEYYCDGDNKANQNVRCENKCMDGKCI